MDLNRMIKDKLNNPATLGKLAQSVGASPEQVQKLAALALPALIGGMTDNTQDPDGARSLASALDQHQDDPVDDVDGYLDHVDRQDGEKIVNHLLRGEKAHVENSLARRSGLDAGQVGSLLVQLAPLLMGLLGKQKRSAGLDAGGLPGLLSQLAGMFGLGGGNAGGYRNNAMDDGLDRRMDQDMDGRIENVGDIGAGRPNSDQGMDDRAGSGACGLSSLLSRLDADQDGSFMDDINTMFDKFRNR